MTNIINLHLINNSQQANIMKELSPEFEAELKEKVFNLIILAKSEMS